MVKKAAAKKVPKRRHNRKPVAIKPDDTDAIAARDDALRLFHNSFTNELPEHPGTEQHARNGYYTQVEGDRFDGREYPIPDGKYRIVGSDWVYGFEGGGFVDAQLATKENGYGGKDVVQVDIGPGNTKPGNG